MSGPTKISGADVRQPRPAKRGYEAASGRRGGIEGYFGTMRSADSEIFYEARTLRDKSRALVRNNPFAAKSVAALASNIIGEGIVPRPATGNKARDRKIWAAFQRWSYRCDVGGQLDFYALQTLLCREMIEGGEVLIRRRLREKTGDGDIPLELQILEADFLDPYRNGRLIEGGLTIQGVDTSLDTHKRRFYWLYPFHPGSFVVNYGEPLVSKPVPADEVLHVYEMQRVQTRGVPWGTPAIESLGLLADYELAEIVRKKIEACAVAAVSGAEDETEDSVGPKVLDINGAEVEHFEPGMILRLHGSKQVTFHAPNAVGGYAEYKASQLKTIAAAYRVPYELISGDLSEINFSSMRGGLVEFRRLVGAVQWQILIQMALQPIWVWWCEIAYLAGEIDVPYVPVEWSPPKFEWVDPMADTQAAALEVRNGFRTWQDVVAEKGCNPDDVLEDIQAWNEKTDDLGIILDSDPRKTNAKGVQQPAPESDTGNEPELVRPNRSARRKDRRAAQDGPGRSGPAGKLQRGRQYDRDRLDDRSGRSSVRLVGRHGIR